MTIALRRRSIVDAIIREPIHLAISQPHQVAISSISVSLMAIFFASSGAVPAPAAWAGAIGVEYAYLKGLSDAAYTRSAWGGRLVWGAFAIIVIAGISVLLRDAYHLDWMIRPSGGLAVLLAVLHILPLAFIGLCSANLHMESESQRVAADQAAADRAAQIRHDEEDAARARRLRWAAIEDEIAAERQRKAAEIDIYEAAALAKPRRRRAAQEAAQEAARHPHGDPAQEAARHPHGDPAQAPHAAPECRMRQIAKDELVRRVRAALKADPAFNREAMARETGWSAAMIRKVIRELSEG